MSETTTFYIFHGDDGISIDQALAKIRNAMGEDANGDMNTSEFDGTQTTVPEVLGAAKSFPFLSDKRLVIVRGLIRHITRKGAGETGKKAVNRLVDDLPSLPDYARLVMIERETLTDGNKVLKAVKNMGNGYIGKFEKPKNLTGWIINRAKKEYQAEILPQAAQAIANVVNDDMRRADNELYKLVCYVDDDHPINEQDVATLTPYVPEANVFEMVDALAVGNGEKALRLIRRALHDDPRDPGFGLFSMIVRQFRLLLMVREHLDSGGGSHNKVIASALGVHPFVAGKIATQSRTFKVDQLDSIIKRLQKYDQDMKTGRIEARLALDLLVTSLAKK
jgi:DNA polymerase III subunit delta